MAGDDEEDADNAGSVENNNINMGAVGKIEDNEKFDPTELYLKCQNMA